MRSELAEVRVKRRAGLVGDVETGMTNGVEAGNGTITLSS